MSAFKNKMLEFISITILFLIYVLTWVPFFNRSALFRKLGTLALKPFIKSFGVNINYYNKSEILPKQFIMIANHVSALDILVLLPYFPNLYVFSDIVHEKIPIFGRIVQFARTIPIDRRSTTSRMSGVEKLVEHLQQKHNVLIFPQALTDDKIAHFSQGAFIASKKTLIPILPVFMVFKPLNTFFLRPGEAYKAALDKLRKTDKKSLSIHVFPSFQPENYATPEDFAAAALKQYQTWHKELQG